MIKFRHASTSRTETLTVTLFNPQKMAVFETAMRRAGQKSHQLCVLPHRSLIAPMDQPTRMPSHQALEEGGMAIAFYGNIHAQES